MTTGAGFWLAPFLFREGRMTKSREDLVNRALAKLKVTAAGQQPSAEDKQVVDDQVEPMLAKLSRKNIYAYGDPDEIEDECFEDLAGILAVIMANDFGGVRIDPDMPNETFRQNCENSLREINAETLSYQPLQGQYF